ncbi:MAG TPA: SDR family NAD(P)-dependent oxidoreductase, partial [Bacteroidota bacterium]|nr:SDR family NAD(P)-dependent oxidoreductase [Bacteroidota bacterium]
MASSKSRIVWITGAGSGIGSALAAEFAARGDRVILSGRTDSRLQALQTAIRQKKGEAEVVRCDVMRPDSVEAAARSIREMAGVPDILVNNAGITVFKNFLDTSVEEFDNIVQTNLRGSFLATRAVLPSMMARSSGLILNIVSFAAKTTYT